MSPRPAALALAAIATLALATAALAIAARGAAPGLVRDSSAARRVPAFPARTSPDDAPRLIPPIRPGLRVPGRIHAGLVETVIARGIDSPVSMAIAPDDRIFVCEQGGRLRVIRDGELLAKPFVVVPAHAEIEEGLLGVAFDPEFPRRPFVYVCYTAGAPARHNRVERYTASGDTALPGSARVLIDLDPHRNHLHVGGALRFGRDGMLYIGTGDNDLESLAQSLGSTFGKLMRIDRDGGIPPDGPFVNTARGIHRAIWARGLRNVFSFDVEPGSGRMFINDVGASAYEEIDEGAAGANYGWPLYEGPRGDEHFRAPLYAYGHDAGCAITGGAFYRPARPALPTEWFGRYLFADYCAAEIRWIDPAAPARSGVLGRTLVQGPVDLRVGPDGALYYLARGNASPVGGEHTASGIVVRVASLAGSERGAR